jgi:hypothetical protein
MPKLQVTFFRHRRRTGVFAVSPVSTNLVFLEPRDWEMDRQEMIAPDLVSPGSEIAGWLESLHWVLRLGADVSADCRPQIGLS